MDEMRDSLSKQRYLDRCRKYCPDLSVDDGSECCTSVMLLLQP
jgi:hypothetical protein